MCDLAQGCEPEFYHLSHAEDISIDLRGLLAIQYISVCRVLTLYMTHNSA